MGARDGKANRIGYAGVGLALGLVAACGGGATGGGVSATDDLPAPTQDVRESGAAKHREPFPFQSVLPVGSHAIFGTVRI